MPDIAMCEGFGCPWKEDCYRFTAKPSEWRQSYFMETPFDADKQECSEFIEGSTEKHDA